MPRVLDFASDSTVVQVNSTQVVGAGYLGSYGGGQWQIYGLPGAYTLSLIHI